MQSTSNADESGTDVPIEIRRDALKEVAEHTRGESMIAALPTLVAQRQRDGGKTTYNT